MEEQTGPSGKKPPLRRLLAFLSGMRFSVVLLALILAGCAAGSVVPQNNPQALQAMFGSVGAGALHALWLDRVFRAPWFAACAALLSLNLALCSVLRFPQVLRRFRALQNPDRRPAPEAASFSFAAPGADLSALRMRRVRRWTDESGRAWQAASANAAGVFGSWLCHLGILLLIVAFAAGQRLSREWVVYGIAGSEQPLGDSGLSIRIDDFRILLRDDFTVGQYEADLALSDGRKTVSGTASVNHPLRAFGMDLYQDSTGWACYVDISEDGEPVKTDLICVGEYAWPDSQPNLLLLFSKFYPDFERLPDGSLVTKTPLLNNPRMLYSLFYQEKMIGMNLAEPGTPVTVERYAFTMRDPVPYTLIVARRDPTAPMAGAAAIVVLLGLFLAFYVRPYELLTDGRTVWGCAPRAPGLLEAQLRRRLRADGTDGTNGRNGS